MHKSTAQATKHHKVNLRRDTKRHTLRDIIVSRFVAHARHFLTLGDIARHIKPMGCVKMGRLTPVEELKQIESIIAAHPSGIGIAGIEAEIEHR